MKLGVFSGEVYQGQCGEQTKLKNINGDSLFVGDIVIVSTVDEFGICNNTGLSVVVKNKDEDGHFVMGIKTVSFNEDVDYSESKETNWIVKRVKKYDDCIDGERWRDYGFNYKKIVTDSNGNLIKTENNGKR